MRTLVLTTVTPHAVIFVAGTGTRLLLPVTADRPKCLVEVGGETILSRILRQLAAAGMQDVCLATGHCEPMLRDWVTQRQPRVDVSFVSNPAYATTNNAYSLWMTRKSVGDRSLLLCDGDVLLEDGVLERLIRHPSENALLIEPRDDMGEEEMKAAVDGARVTRLTKTMDPKEAFGESIGVQKIGNTAALWHTLEEMIQGQGGADLYYEDAFQRLIDGGVDFAPVSVGKGEWIEIDDAADLERARARFGPR